MLLITWSDEYSVGISTIDTQHKKLIDLINELHDNMQNGKGIDAVGQLLDELVDYTKYHFSTEEKFFDSTSYPDAEVHKEEHRAFVAKVEEYQKNLNATTALSTLLGISKFLWDWLSIHIMKVDKKYSPWLIEKGIK